MVLTTVTVSLSATTIQVGQTATANATGADQNGGSISTGTVTWSLSSPSVASITAGGSITAVAAGQTTISATAGGKSGQTTLTVIPVPIASVVVSPTVPALMFVGGTQQLTAVTMDASNAALTGRTVTWSSSDTAKARVSTSGLVTAIAAGTAGISAASEGKSGTVNITIVPVPVATVTVSPGTATLSAGASQQLSATTLDASGATLAGRVVTWFTSDVTKATVTATGLVTAVAVGTATITATSEAKTGTSVITVTTPAPVATVTVAPLTASIVVGGTVVLTATARDASGNILSGRTWAWTANLSVATGSFQGNVLTALGVGAGVTAITATSEGKSGSSTVTVVVGVPAITSVAPATLTPGSTVTIVGTNFSATAGNNVVRIGGVSASITSISTTQITAAVPCLASGTVPVVVSTGGINSAAVNATLAGTVRTLAIGQSVVLTSAATSACNELPAAVGAAKYLVAVFNSATSQNTLADMELRGNAASTVSTADAAFQQQVLRAQRARSSAAPTSGSIADRAHLEQLEAGRALYSQMRASGYRDPVRQPHLTSAAIAASLGDRRTFVYNYGSVSDTTRLIGARAIYIGTKAVIWEDTTNTRLSAADATLASYYQRIGQQFDQEQYDVIRTNFGDPLRRDANTDADGKLGMIFTHRVNADGRFVAYVYAVDQYPRTVYAASNFGEYFYSSVPTLAGSNPNSSAYADGWFAFIGRAVIHEVKHIASHAARLVNNAPSFEESWLEEGLARQAEEVWVRPLIHRVSWKGNSGYGTAATNGLFCDFNTASTTCTANDPVHRPTQGLRRQFNETLPKLQEPWNWSIYGDGTGQTGSIFYNSVWSLARYAIDRYGASDATFLTALNNATTTGVTNLSAVAGVSMDQLLGGWSLALYADDYPGLASPSADINFPTWNLRNIYSGLNGDPAWSSRFAVAFPLVPSALSFGAFTATQTGVRGGAGAYFLLSGTMTSAQMLDLRAAGGGAPSSLLRIAIARLP